MIDSVTLEDARALVAELDRLRADNARLRQELKTIRELLQAAIDKANR